jgi:hypothetical protein
MSRKEEILKIINDNISWGYEELDEKAADEIEKLFQPEWRAVREELPENEKKVIVYFKNECGHGRRTTAEYIREKTVLAEDYLSDEWSDGFEEYDEEKDCYWTPSGWYEQQEITEVNFYLGKDIITHWMPLPSPPENKS